MRLTSSDAKDSSSDSYLYPPNLKIKQYKTREKNFFLIPPPLSIQKNHVNFQIVEEMCLWGGGQESDKKYVEKNASKVQIRN